MIVYVTATHVRLSTNRSKFKIVVKCKNIKEVQEIMCYLKTDELYGQVRFAKNHPRYNKYYTVHDTTYSNMDNWRYNHENSTRRE